ncbi:hypothetical protein CRYUN_Cryun23aG0134200 [Craigia yunnanensis]
MDDMKAKGVKPNATTYNAMFKGLKENNLLEDAFRLMDDMIEHACNPDYITMEILTEWLSAVGESEKLKSFVQGYKGSEEDRKLVCFCCLKIFVQAITAADLHLKL